MKLSRSFACVAVLFAGLSGEVAAIGFGELRGEAILGERPVLTVELLSDGKERLDPACFRLRRPNDVELPWLNRATLSIRKGTPPLLEIRPQVQLREPVLQIAVQMTCGQDVVREYTVFASPAMEKKPEKVSVPQVPVADLPRPAVTRQAERPPLPPARPPVLRPKVSSRKAPQPVQDVPVMPAPVAMSDRLVLSGDGGEVGDPGLRLSVDLQEPASDAAIETQRELLRLEYRLLMAMQDQAAGQMSASDRLRALEGALVALRQQGDALGVTAEKQATPPAPVVAPAPPPAVAEPDSGWLTEWALYGLLGGLLFGVGGWLGWRNYRERLQQRRQDDYQGLVPDLEIDPQRSDEVGLNVGVDIPVEPVFSGGSTHVDLNLDAADGEVASNAADKSPPPAARSEDSSLYSISAATVDEHFEANPVMELADIMLSFGRVKGAAQALQEYIDNNPQEALQPWIRLMEVYRMADMRDEFETVARALNHNFNVEVQAWDDKADTLIDIPLDTDSVISANAALRASCLEEMPRIMDQVVRLWQGSDVREYLEQLLRDNRGGQRAGFSMPVVGEILFLIELKDTVHKMEREKDQDE